MPGVFEAAVREFWQTRQNQEERQRQAGAGDQGLRSAVTGGRQMDGFVRTITDLIMAAGVSADCIHTRSDLTLPGFYRPTKDWDIVVKAGDDLLAVIELKSQVGPSFGNNFNNRTEEAMGSAVDIWTAFREGKFGGSPAPFLGYLFLLEDCTASRTPVRVSEPHYLIFEEFRNASYALRYELFCRKLVRERQYNAACFLRADASQSHLSPNYAEPAVDLSAKAFLEVMLRHVRPNRSRP